MQFERVIWNLGQILAMEQPQNRIDNNILDEILNNYQLYEVSCTLSRNGLVLEVSKKCNS